MQVCTEFFEVLNSSQYSVIGKNISVLKYFKLELSILNHLHLSQFS